MWLAGSIVSNVHDKFLSHTFITVTNTFVGKQLYQLVLLFLIVSGVELNTEESLGILICSAITDYVVVSFWDVCFFWKLKYDKSYRRASQSNYYASFVLDYISYPDLIA